MSLVRRYVLLCDLDAFYASVEQRDNPEYRGKPLIVGGNPDSRGVVSTCSYEARAFGVRSAMPLATARRLCPGAVFVEPDMAKYQAVSGQFLEILDRYTPDVEAVSIDEAYLEVRGPEGRGVEVARDLRAQVKRDLGITVSVGIAINKFLAKLAAEMAKPDGLREIDPKDAERLLEPLDVGVLPGIGERTGSKLRAMGIRRVGDLKGMPPLFFKTHFGSRGRAMMEFCRGVDQRELELGSDPKSMSEETTFSRDVADMNTLSSTLLGLAEALGYRLRSSGFLARTVTLKLRTEDFESTSRSRSLRSPTADDMLLYQAARDLLGAGTGTKRVRLTGIQVSNLVSRRDALHQGDLFEDSQASQRQEALLETMDHLRRRFGMQVIRRAGGRLHRR
ncbi:MAG: DNA polymerase IV [Bacillota bacterium]